MSDLNILGFMFLITTFVYIFNFEYLISKNERLKYEIKLLKENNIELTDEEKFFDTFMIKPSSITRILLSRLEEKNKGDYNEYL